MKIRNLAEKN